MEYAPLAWFKSCRLSFVSSTILHYLYLIIGRCVKSLDKELRLSSFPLATRLEPSVVKHVFSHECVNQCKARLLSLNYGFNCSVMERKISTTLTLIKIKASLTCTLFNVAESSLFQETTSRERQRIVLQVPEPKWSP